MYIDLHNIDKITLDTDVTVIQTILSLRINRNEKSNNNKLLSLFSSNVKMATTTFAVAKVDPCTKKHVETEDLSEADVARWTIGDQKLSLENFQTNYRLAADLNGRNRRIQNAFVGTIFKAYCEHYPLELSVEDFWVAIAQGVSIHLNENAEKYRELMVSHEG